MKRILLIIACLFSSVFVFSQEMSNKDKWQIKTYREKYSYIEGFFDCGLNLGSAIENQISKKESKKQLSKETGDYIEIPIIYVSFAVGNAKTNGIDSIIEYIDECYKNNKYSNYSVYELLSEASRVGLRNNPKFKWMFEEE